MRSDRGKTYVSSGILLPSKVTHLVIKRPSHFCFRPGDYVFINIPAIAKYEWHPFTLSSAPEDDEHIGLHIRAVGEWTNRLFNFFMNEEKRLQNGEILPYDEQIDPKQRNMEDFVMRSKLDKVDERSDGTTMRGNMMMACDQVMKVKLEKSNSMPDMDNKMKKHERFKK